MCIYTINVVILFIYIYTGLEHNTMKYLFLLFLVSVGTHSFPQKKEAVDLSIIHMNDFHARFEETNDSGGSCSSDNCIGGLSRMYEQILQIREKDPNIILLNGGDTFQGTLWYSLFKWNVTQYFMNQFNFDAIVLGNHEFDDGIDGITPFMKAVKAPIVVANIDDELEPSFQGLYSKSTIVERNGLKIGIIGVITPSTSLISSPGDLKFLDASTSVNLEAERLVAEENVFTVIVLSHCGYDVDMVIAENATSKVGLIVGGHSHTFLYTGEPSPGPDTPEGPYPTIMERKDGKSTLIIQASAYSKYLGNLTVTYDSEGEYVDWSGSPIFLDTNLPQNEKMNKELAVYKEEIDEIGKEVLGSTLVDLTQGGCYVEECLLGNFVTDGYVYSFTKKAQNGSWTYASIAIMNAGGLRTDILAGNVTYSDLITAQPFGNTVDISDFQGKYIKELLESTASTEYYYGKTYASISLIQVSGIKFTLDLNQPVGERVVSVKILCNECAVPEYEDLDLEKMYRIITPSFLTAGGDNFMALNHLENTIIGEMDIDVLSDYLKEKSPINQEIEGRIVIIGQENVECIIRE